MEVCDICGCFLIVGDAQSRVDEHYLGKQHLGYAKIKATLDELEVGGELLVCSGKNGGLVEMRIMIAVNR